MRWQAPLTMTRSLVGSKRVILRAEETNDARPSPPLPEALGLTATQRLPMMNLGGCSGRPSNVDLGRGAARRQHHHPQHRERERGEHRSTPPCASGLARKLMRYGGPPGLGKFTCAIAKPHRGVRTSRTLSASSIASGSLRHLPSMAFAALCPTARSALSVPNTTTGSMESKLTCVSVEVTTSAVRSSRLREDGARRDVLQVITHAPDAADVMSLYTTYPWSTLCAEVAKLQIALPERPEARCVASSAEVANSTSHAQPLGRTLAGSVPWTRPTCRCSPAGGASWSRAEWLLFTPRGMWRRDLSAQSM
jgi:hypothetical protein